MLVSIGLVQRPQRSYTVLYCAKAVRVRDDATFVGGVMNTRPLKPVFCGRSTIRKTFFSICIINATVYFSICHMYLLIGEKRQCCTMIDVEVCDQQEVHCAGVDRIEERQRTHARVCGMNATVELKQERVQVFSEFAFRVIQLRCAR